jgi:hypothetical protein
VGTAVVGAALAMTADWTAKSTDDCNQDHRFYCIEA